MGDDPLVASHLRAAAAGHAAGSALGAIVGCGFAAIVLAWVVSSTIHDGRAAELAHEAASARERAWSDAFVARIDAARARLVGIGAPSRVTVATDEATNEADRRLTNDVDRRFRAIGAPFGGEEWAAVPADAEVYLNVRVVAPGDPDYDRAWPVYPVDEETAAALGAVRRVRAVKGEGAPAEDGR